MRTPKDWVWAYHTAHEANLPSIQKEGLRPERHEHVEDAPVIFVERELEGLEPYITRESVVLRFRTPGFGGTEDGEDVIFGGPGSSREGYPDPPLVGPSGSDGVIPPDQLQVLVGKKWRPLEKKSG
jgi:hypothetical protein